jgi:predicted phage baseplate assembly protein
VTSPLFTLLRAQKETAIASGNQLNFYGNAQAAKTLKNRRILVERTAGESGMLTVVDVDPASAAGTASLPQLHRITLSANVDYADFPNVTPVATVFGNLADADEGMTLPEAAIGSGDATRAFQNFKLPKAPLSYHIVAGNTPCETPQAQIFVDGHLWTRVDSFFGRGPNERLYIVREDAAGNSWVQFGDGKTGARLTNGTNNVTAIFRKGAGAFGPLKGDTRVQASAKLANLDQVQMPQVVTGGAPPEDGENARNAAPGRVQSLGRMVSLMDFEAEAAAIPGVARAASAWQLVDNVPAVVVTVLMDTGRGAEIKAVRDTLHAYNTKRGAGRTSIAVDQGRRMYVAVSLQYALRPGFRADRVEPEIRRALGVNFGRPVGREDQSGLFGLRQRRFGGPEYASSIEGVAQNVPGVLWTRATAFVGLMDADEPAEIALPPIPVIEPVIVCDAGHILSLHDRHLSLTAVKAQVSANG